MAWQQVRRRSGRRPHSGAGLRAQYTSPTGLSFLYHDYKLCLVDKERDMLYILKEGVAPPTTGLRAQFIWGTQSSCITASVAAYVTCTWPNCLEAVPDTVLQFIGQQLVHDATSPDAEYEAAVAAASLACTGSRAALIIAHAVWALLDPDSLKPDKHVQILQLSQSAADSVSSKPAWQVSRKEKKRLKKAQRKGHAAAAALCTLADPLQCSLRFEAPCFQMHHRALAAQEHLRHFKLTVNSLPYECGVRGSMTEWIKTGYLDGIKHDGIMAVNTIILRRDRLQALQAVVRRELILKAIDGHQQCRDYVRTGVGRAASIVLQLALDRLDAALLKLKSVMLGQSKG